MAEFEKTHPKTQASLAIGNSARIIELLHANEIDLGFVGIKPDAGEFISKATYDDEIVPFVSPRHPLARAKKISIDDLLGHRLILREATSATRRLFDRWMGRREAPLNVMELGSPETVKRAAAAGLGIGFLSRFAIQWEQKGGMLKELKVPQFPIRRPLFMVHHRRKHLSRTIQAFVDLLNAARA